VRENGTFTSVGQSVSEGKIKLVDGRLMYETTLSKGTLSLEDRRGKQILNVVGTTDRSARVSKRELQHRACHLIAAHFEDRADEALDPEPGVPKGRDRS